MALEQYETFFCTGEEQYFHHRISGDRRQSQEWEKIKKNGPTAGSTSACLAYSSIICLVK